MGELTAWGNPVAAVGESNNFAVSFDKVVDSGELLTGTPTVEEVTTTDLTIENKAVSGVALSIRGETVAIGKAVTFSVSGQTLASSPYTVKITVSTDSTPSQTKIRFIQFYVGSD